MRWFKHMTNSASDEKLALLRAEFGLEGYGFWWRILEIIAEKADENGKDFAQFPTKYWGNLLELSPNKFRKLAEFCAKLELLILNYDQKLITIKVPNILKIRDEYTEKKARKSGQNPDTLPPLLTDTEIETETEEDKNKKVLFEYSSPPLVADDDQSDNPGDNSSPEEQEKDKSSTVPLCPFSELVELYHETLPTLGQVKKHTDARQAAARGRWRETWDYLRKKNEPHDKSALLDYFRRYFEYVEKSDFLMGRIAKWSASFEWLLKAANFAKVIEENYHDKDAA